MKAPPEDRACLKSDVLDTAEAEGRIRHCEGLFGGATHSILACAVEAAVPWRCIDAVQLHKYMMRLYTKT